MYNVKGKHNNYVEKKKDLKLMWWILYNIINNKEKSTVY